MSIEGCSHSIFRHDHERMAAVFGALPALAALEDPGGIPAIVAGLSGRNMIDRWARSLRERFDPAFAFYRDIVHGAQPGDPAYLYRYGSRVTEHDVRLAAHVEGLAAGSVDLIAGTIVNGFELGFSTEGKDLSKKNAAALVFPAGFERIALRVEEMLSQHGISTVFNSVSFKPANRQCNYDHRFDWALFIDQPLLDEFSDHALRTYEALKPLADAYAGPIGMSTFGHEPFTPVPNPSAAEPDAARNTLYRMLNMKLNELNDSYSPRSEVSFTSIAFPSPETRGDFGRIFDDTMRMNTLDNTEYSVIQKAIIDALDTAGHIRVKGAEGNRTDLRISMHRLDDPARQSNFLNCLATVNIPLGEVFTSPVLAGTSGTLHVEEAFISGLKYVDLVMEFRDGYVADYGCGNFPDPEEGRRYVYQNMLHPHRTLPMGEFAIGTNTWAYRMACEHGIMDLMPVLILEKMGPHLAIGDTCFSWEEDHPVHNPIDGKEVVARDNEKSCARRTDPMEAYTNRHTDITLPYSSLGSISAVSADGAEVFVYRNGRFVLPGTEKLNEALQ
jgi:hypothetical protein